MRQQDTHRKQEPEAMSNESFASREEEVVCEVWASFTSKEEEAAVSVLQLSYDVRMLGLKAGT